MEKNINIKVQSDVIEEPSVKISSNKINKYRTIFELDSMWDSLIIKAVFSDRAKNKTIVQYLDSDNSCTVPHEMLAEKGDVFVNLVGSEMIDGVLTERMTSFRAHLFKITVVPVDGANGLPPTPSEIEQLTSIVSEAKSIAQSVRTEADQGKFNGAPGKDGITPIKGKDYFDGEKGDPFRYEDFTPEQLEGLKGPKGDAYIITEADKQQIARDVEQNYTEELGSVKKDLSSVNYLVDAKFVDGYLNTTGGLNPPDILSKEKTTGFISVNGETSKLTMKYPQNPGADSWVSVAYYDESKIFIKRVTVFSAYVPDGVSVVADVVENASYIRWTFRTYGSNDIVITTSKSTRTKLQELKDEVYENANKLIDVPLEIGNLYFGSSYWEYQDNTTRIRTPKGYTVSLKAGDYVYFTDYTDLKYYIGWRDKDGGYKSVGWLSKAYKITEEGTYAFLICNATEKTITDASILGSRLRVVSHINLKDTISKNELDDMALSIKQEADENYIHSELYNNGFIPILPANASQTGESNKGYSIQYDSVAKKITILSDTIPFNKVVNGKDSIIGLNNKVIDLSPFATSAIKILFNIRTKEYYAKAYDVANTSDERFVALVRTSRKAISTPLPYIIDGKPYGIDLLENNNIKSVNHRGYVDAPENTLSAYRLSKKNGFDYVETDVSFTSDGIAVCLHDSTINRTSNGTGSISEMTFEQARQYDFGSWKNAKYAGEKIPSFEEFIKLCKQIGLHPYIELKSNGAYTQNDVKKCLDIVKLNGMQGKVTWISFSNTYLGYVKALDESARLGYVCDVVSESVISNANALKTEKNEVFIDASVTSVNATIVNRCVNADLPLEVWTVNEAETIKSLHPYISGVTSDYANAGKILLNANI